MEMNGACRGAKFQEGRGQLGSQKDFQSTLAAEKQELQDHVNAQSLEVCIWMKFG